MVTRRVLEEPDYCENPRRFGAKMCPNCEEEGDLLMEAKAIAKGVSFIEISCAKCGRLSASDPASGLAGCLRSAIDRWNSKWPDVSFWLDSDSEGFRSFTTL